VDKVQDVKKEEYHWLGLRDRLRRRGRVNQLSCSRMVCSNHIGRPERNPLTGLPCTGPSSLSISDVGEKTSTPIRHRQPNSIFGRTFSRCDTVSDLSTALSGLGRARPCAGLDGESADRAIIDVAANAGRIRHCPRGRVPILQCRRPSQGDDSSITPRFQASSN